jgi:hypothetical protein
MENLYFYPYPHAEEADFQEHHPPSTWGTASVDFGEHLEQGPEEWWDALWNEHVDQPGNDTVNTVQEHDLPSPHTAPNKKIKYTLLEKKQIVSLVESKKMSVSAAASRWAVDRKSIRDWKAQLLRHESEDLVGRKSFGRGRKIGYEDVGQHIVTEIIRLREKNICVSVPVVATMALTFQPSMMGGSKKNVSNWVRRVMKANNLSVRTVTRQSQTIVEDAAEQTADMVALVWSLMQQHGITIDCVANMDETSVPFEIQPKKTIAPRGSKTVTVVKAKNGTNKATACLGVTLDGKKLKPYVVFQGSPTGRLVRKVNVPGEDGACDHRCVYSFQTNGWMDRDHMLDWIKKIWRPFVQEKRSLHNQPFFILMLDCFTAHLCADVVSTLSSKFSTFVVEVPKSTTSVSQIMDVGINKPFKNSLELNQMAWRLQAGYNGKITRQLISQWIADSWDSITAEMITNTVRHIGFNDTEL